MGRPLQPQQFFDPAGSFALADALTFAIDLAEALRVRQSQDGGVPFGHLCLSNVLLDNEGRPSLRDEARDTLAYLAPEQSGRMNRKVDQRSDYYALGAIYYEQFTGQLPFPFPAGDLVELVHAHIARRPAPPHSLNPRLPQQLGDLLQKLLAKNAEDRYQTLDGLLADLRLCQRLLQTQGAIPAFPLGLSDHSGRLQIPQKLYGREAEAGLLLQAFSRAAQGSAEMVLVSGYAGIGKTALVHEIHQPVVWRRGYFASGKFDQFKRNIPYSALHDALRELMRQVLAEDESRISAWRSALHIALGMSGNLVVDAVPELGYLLGPLPPAPRSLMSAAAYSHAMQKLVGVFARAEHPLVLFLDDLQWADAASLKLMHQLLKEIDDPCLLLIGAYRDNGGDTGDHGLPEDHPLAQAIAAMAAEVPVHRIGLAPLAEDSIAALLADTFRCAPQLAAPLATLVQAKTMGNPFFVSQFLRSLHHEGLLEFRGGSWQWDLAAIEALHITDNVVDLLTRDIGRLPQATRNMLGMAAAIGSRFDASLLSVLAGVDDAEVGRALAQARDAGLIRSAGHDGRDGEGVQAWQFQHDRVQQAAYESIAPEARPALHQAIGEALLASIAPAQREERIFDIVPQLNQARARIAGEAQRLQLAELNLLAAKRARESAALELHLDFVRIAEELGATDDWRARPAFMHALTMEKVSAAFARGDYRAMASLCQVVADNSETPEQAIAAKNMLLRCYGSMYKPAEMMATGLELMALAGISAPKKIRPWHLWSQRLRLACALRGRDPLKLADKPEPTDPVYLRELLATTALLGFGLAFARDSRVVEWLSLYLMRKAVRYGVSPSAAYAFAVWATRLAGQYDKPIEAFKFGKVGALLGARGAMVTLSTVSLFEGIVRHRREDLRLTLAPLNAVYQRAMERGDRTGAVVALSFADSMLFHAGLPLPEALDKVRRDIRVCQRMDYPGFMSVMAPLALMLGRLAGTTVAEVDDGRSLEDHARERLAARDPWGVFYVRAWQCIADYFEGDAAAAFAHASEAIALPGFANGMVHSAWLMFICSLAELELARSTSHPLAGVVARQRRFASWARHAPMNYEAKWQIVQAQLLLQRGRWSEAIALFEAARDGARRNGHAGDEALACELLGRHYERAGRSVEARAWLEEAHGHYRRWGALAKAQAMERQHPESLRRLAEERRHAAGADQPGGKGLDLAAITRAGQALSGEIQLDGLLRKLMHILIENAGAERGVLLLKQDGVLAVQAKYAARGAEAGAIDVLQDSAPEEDNDVCMAIVNYVRRTRETLVLGDAQKDPRFQGDAHVRRGVLSVLCVPLKKQGQVSGILYLENNLAADAFTPALTELLQMLASQAAISLENASLYDALEQKIAARTALLSERNEELSAALQTLRQAQKQLVEAEKLASLGQLVAGVAHEINTPIGIAVTGASTLAERTEAIRVRHAGAGLRRSDVDAYLESAGTISMLLLSNMERAAALVQSFKAVAVDQTSDERRPFKLRAYLEDVLRNLSPLLRRTEHVVTLACDDAIMLDTYPGALSQIVTNLVTNALQHAFDGKPRGEMRIDVRAETGGRIALRFSDDGSGIPPAVQGKIFEPFFTTRRGRGGSGLGLNIVYNLVTGRLQGSIAVESQPGQGTCFILHFPAALPRATVHPINPSTSAVHAAKRSVRGNADVE